jgi:hypothetical protein
MAKQKSGLSVAVQDVKPRLHVSGDDCIDCKMGEEVVFTVKGKLVSDSMDSYDGEDRHNQSFEIVKMEKSKDKMRAFAEKAQESGKGMKE